MANLTIEMPDDLERHLNRIAAAQHKSIQELALERLRSLVETSREELPGSATAVLRAVHAPPRVDATTVDELEAAIAAGRMPVRTGGVFPDDER